MRVFKVLGVLLLAVSMSSCAVMMALHGKQERDISQVRRGMHRTDVMFHLGQDNLSETKSVQEGTIDIFRIPKGNAPSAGRAIGHAVMDLLTWGAWEIIGTPVEAFSSSLVTVTVYYDQEDTVTKIVAGEAKSI